MQIVASYHHKGGVGKTTTAVALAAHAAASGARTLLWDLDPQGAATRLVGAERGEDGVAERLLRGRADVADQAVDTRRPRLELVPADLSLRSLDRDLGGGAGSQDVLCDALERTGGRYDVVVLDCPPSVSSASEAVIRAAQLVVVPLTAGPLAWSAYADLFFQVDEVAGDDAPEVLAFLTMVDRRRRLHRELIEDLEDPSDGLSAVHVPTDSRVERMALDDDPTRAVLTGRAGRAYGELWAEVFARTASPSPVSASSPAEDGAG